MTVTPVMSSSSSTATVVSMVSPENTCLGHWARIRLRMIRRTARVKVEENRLDPVDKDVRAQVTLFPRLPTSGKAIIDTRLLNSQRHRIPPHPVNFRM